MENSTTEQTDVQEQGPKKGIVIIVIAILLGTNALLLWQFFEKKNSLDIANRTIITTSAEKDALQSQLNQVKADYEKVKSDNENLQTELASKDEEIKSKVAQIQHLITIGGPAEIARAKAELAKLKELNAVYIVQIDSLNKINTQLQTENQSLSTNLTTEKSKNDNLSNQNSKLAVKVAAGSILKAMSIVTEGLRYKSNGKEVITLKAKQVQKMRTKFTLNENHVLDKGPADIYLRVLNPDGSVMSPDQLKFDSNGSSLVYTSKETVEYNNQDLPVQIIWVSGTTFQQGKYSVEIYHNGVLIGTSAITLK